MPFDNDGTITHELLIERINSDLANILGNLVNRTIAMSNKYFGGVVTNAGVKEDVDDELIAVALDTKKRVDAKMEQLRVADAISEIFTLLRRSNKYIDETMPWALAKDETKQERLQTVLYNLIESIRIAAVLLDSFLPETSQKILDQINTDQRSYETVSTFGLYASGSKVTDQPQALFMRLDPKVILAQVEAKKAPVKEEKKEPEVPEITIEDFAKVELKVGTVVKCEKHPKADKLLVSQVSLGNETRQIVSGIASCYSPEDMVGRKVIVVTNLKPANLRGVESQGMLLAGQHKKKIALATLAEALPDGTKIS